MARKRRRAGIAAVQLARAAGLRVDWERRERNADENWWPMRARMWYSTTRQRTISKGRWRKPGNRRRLRTLILEMLANVNLGRDLPLLAQYGRVVVIGSRGTVEVNPRDAMGRDAAILGVALPNISRNDLIAIHSAIVAGLENKTLRPVVGQEIPLPEAPPRSHAEVLARQASYGKDCSDSLMELSGFAREISNMERSASAVWNGALRDGKGAISTQSGVLS